MLGHFTRVEAPMEKGDDIIDIAMTDNHVILYNNKYFRFLFFSKKFVIMISSMLHRHPLQQQIL
jgi:hypothetical protein